MGVGDGSFKMLLIIGNSSTREPVLGLWWAGNSVRNELWDFSDRLSGSTLCRA